MILLEKKETWTFLNILDSLGFAELLTRIEEETGVIISPSEVVRDDINTVNKILELVKSKKQG